MLARVHSCLLLSLLGLQLARCQDQEFRLGSLLSDGVVLQREQGEVMPRLWGRGTPGHTVVAVLDQGEEPLVQDMGAVGEDGSWSGHLATGDRVGAGYTLQVTATDPDSGETSGQVELVDVSLGEVWVCSGQSNMGFTVRQARDADMEIEKAVTYENIRLTKLMAVYSNTSLEEPRGYSTQWSRPESDYLHHASFSAVCLFFGQQVQDDLGGDIPFGLVDATWGGTIIEAWSPPEVMEACGITDEGTNNEQNHNTYLWNGMIHPLLQMTVRGAIWYQGEANTGHNREVYDCTFQHMISAWRDGWFYATNGATDPNFPFGFVQLGPNSAQKNNHNWAVLRWKQTGEQGFTPNTVMDNVFMAAAMDDDIDLHPKNKRLPASRLAWAGAHLVYGLEELPLMGPQPVEALSDEAGGLFVEFSDDLELVEDQDLADRFMVCCQATMESCDTGRYGSTGWRGVTITGMLSSTTVSLDTAGVCDEGSSYTGLAYLWLETPCAGEAQCPLYSVDSFRMPVAPFKMEVPTY